MSLCCRHLTRSILVGLVVCVAAGPAQAQQATSTESLNSLLVEGMTAVLQVASWPCLYTGRFEQQRSLPGNSIAIKSTGQFLFDCQHGLLWETARPVASTQVYSKGGERFAVNSNGRTKPLGGRVQARIASLLLALMGGDASALEKDFTHSLQSGEHKVVALSPRRAALAQHIKQISITHLANSIDIAIVSPAGSVTDIRLLQMSTQALPAVTVCAHQSPQAAITCPLLFDAASGKP